MLTRCITLTARFETRLRCVCAGSCSAERTTTESITPRGSKGDELCFSSFESEADRGGVVAVEGTGDDSLINTSENSMETEEIRMMDEEIENKVRHTLLARAARHRCS